MQIVSHSNSQDESTALYDEAFERRVIDWMAEFAGGVGHELNNPLAIMSGYAQKLLKEETDKKKRLALASIIAQANRAYEMIADVRAFSRPPKPRLKPLELARFFEDWVARESNRTMSENAKIESEIVDVRELEIETDEAILAAILDAIGKNAAETTSGRNGNLYFFALRAIIEEQPEDDSADPRTRRVLEIGVEDDGPGISEEEARLIFAPFFSARQAGRGLGFGLPKAWRYAEALNARLLCEKSRRFETGMRCCVQIPLD